MTKDFHDENVDSSYTVLYLFFTVIGSVAVSAAFGSLSSPILFAVMGYAILSYFIWDLIRQLFSPGQAIFLYVITFFILPVLMNYLLVTSVGTLAITIYVAANIGAIVFESIYEGIVKKRLPSKVLRRLLAVDTKIDKSIAPLSIKHIQLTEVRGIAVALSLIAIYFLAILLLLHL
ncbi:MAG: hypothetical protein JWO54_559 [Candidatus Saccharibacteria bacterium]|nr:hypothetical protein [Candidatus Saccharibacteria bacterium]MDB5180780.1 hypothetical protein [Candidatus Saccharibacteria bacterium]MDB5180799.1 hypothetical protein [Candidatus Saccharibacteria bacterium]